MQTKDALADARRRRTNLKKKIANTETIIAGNKISPYDYTAADVEYLKAKLVKLDEQIARLEAR